MRIAVQEDNRRRKEIGSIIAHQVVGSPPDMYSSRA